MTIKMSVPLGSEWDTLLWSWRHHRWISSLPRAHNETLTWCLTGSCNPLQVCQLTFYAFLKLKLRLTFSWQVLLPLPGRNVFNSYFIHLIFVSKERWVSSWFSGILFMIKCRLFLFRFWHEELTFEKRNGRHPDEEKWRKVKSLPCCCSTRIKEFFSMFQRPSSSSCQKLKWHKKCKNKAKLCRLSADYLQKVSKSQLFYFSFIFVCWSGILLKKLETFLHQRFEILLLKLQITM